jgi:ribosomal protein S18 acetylase RimI-like enzyme
VKKAKISQIDPAKDLVDVWRLFRSSVTNEKWDYPYLGETHESEVMAYLNRYMLTTPSFFGLIMRIGKRPIAHVIGHINVHPVGSPKVYFFVHNFWVEPEFRGNDMHGDALFKAMIEEIRKRGVFHWEATCFDKFSTRILKKKRFGVRKLYTRIGGKV